MANYEDINNTSNPCLGVFSFVPDWFHSGSVSYSPSTSTVNYYYVFVHHGLSVSSRIVHWIPLKTSKKMQKKVPVESGWLIVTWFYNIAVNLFDAKTSVHYSRVLVVNGTQCIWRTVVHGDYYVTLIVTTRKWSWGKVMFSQASVSHSVHRRGGYLWYQVPSGGYVGDGYVWRGGEVCEGGVCLGRRIDMSRGWACPAGEWVCPGDWVCLGWVLTAHPRNETWLGIG